MPGGVDPLVFGGYVVSLLLAVAIGVGLATKGPRAAPGGHHAPGATLRAAAGGGLGACAHPVHALFIVMSVFGDTVGPGLVVATGSFALGAVLGAVGWILYRARGPAAFKT